MNKMAKISTPILLSLFALPLNTNANEFSGEIDKTNKKERSLSNMDLAEIAKMTSNPLSIAWMMWFQNDLSKIEGDDLATNNRYLNTVTFQPVMAFPFSVSGEEYTLAVRPAFQYHNAPFNSSAENLFGKSDSEIMMDPELLDAAMNPYDGRTRGTGDTALTTLVGPNREDGVIWGIGITQIFPTAESELLGQGKWQAGPALFAGRIAPNPGGWNYGALIQHWWSYAGDENREDTSQTDLQYLINYRLSETAMVGMTPNIRYDWKADEDQRLSLPIGLGYTNVVRFGRLPIRMALELQHYVKQPDDFGPTWNLRLMFIPILPNPFANY